MTILDGIKKWFNPTCDWKKEPVELIVNLDTHSLNSAVAGCQLDSFKFLGKGKMRRDYSISVDYPELGIALHTGAHGLCDSFLIAYEKLEYPPGFKAYAGKFLVKGKFLSPEQLNSREKVVEILGEPYCKHKDEDEIILFYEFSGEFEWQIEFSLSGKTNAIVITSAPLLEDEEQRLFYQCEKPWPPRF